MRLSISGLFRGRRTIGRRTIRQETYFRPALETLEGRIVLSAPAVLPPPTLAPAVAPAPLAAPTLTGQQLVAQAMNLHFTGFTTNQAGQLMANGTAFNIPLSTPVTLTTTPNAADPTCPILNLHLNAIHLDLLGLNVDTSNICLAINAESGPGNLLGNLLCNVANLLNTGTPLSNILNGLTSVNPTDLTSGLTSLLNGVVNNLTGSLASSAADPQADPGGVCNVLDLSLGPVQLNLLGLEVNLDNCANGPVTVDVTAQPGPGNLLGNLLCNVADLLNQPNATNAVEALLNTILNDINRLL